MNITTIVLIPGLWMIALRWHQWVKHYSDKGYCVVARSWRVMEGDIEHPALTIAGIFFLTINLLAGAYILRHRRRLFDRHARVDGDRNGTRYLQVVVITIPWLFLTFVSSPR
jgi:hypothetical protein